jgi:hypothetical protein
LPFWRSVSASWRLRLSSFPRGSTPMSPSIYRLCGGFSLMVQTSASRSVTLSTNARSWPQWHAIAGGSSTAARHQRRCRPRSKRDQPGSSTGISVRRMAGHVCTIAESPRCFAPPAFVTCCHSCTRCGSCPPRRGCSASPLSGLGSYRLLGTRAATVVAIGNGAPPWLRHARHVREPRRNR